MLKTGKVIEEIKHDTKKLIAFMIKQHPGNAINMKLIEKQEWNKNTNNREGQRRDTSISQEKMGPFLKRKPEDDVENVDQEGVTYPRARHLIEPMCCTIPWL
jgi:hypothetical protein